MSDPARSGIMLAPTVATGVLRRSDDLVGAIVHDFNNQLTAISGFTEFIEQDIPVGDPRRDDVAELRRVTRRAADVTRQFSLFLLQRPGTQRVFCADEVVLALDKMLRRVLREDIVMRMELDAGDVTVSGDPVHLNRVVVDLALDVSRSLAPGGELFIETRQLTVSRGEQATPAGDYVVLTVSDGDVVPQECRVYLPVAAPETTPTIAPGGETVLLVEDEAALRAVARRALDRNGYSILEACNGAEALTVAEQFDGKIDLLLTDIVMPIMGGYALAKVLSTVRPGIRVLFVSGYAPELIGPPRLEGGRSAYLEKPFSTRQLTQAVRGLLDEADL